MTACDVLIAGSGVAGLYTALQARRLGRVLVVTKAALLDASTTYAQGGIAAAIGPGDSPGQHLDDTLAAGDGLCDPAAAAILANEGPQCVLDLVALGARFDRSGEGFSLAREGAHGRRRILHAGDATGREVARTLAAAVRREQIPVLEGRYLQDLLVREGRCIGAVVDGEPILAGATVLATGGAGQVYPCTTNPPVATGDGIAAAWRAGAAIADMEFVQFHPTALPDGFLLSEALRGEGAVLVNGRGERFVHELAPRDVVARAIFQQGTAFLDARPVPELARRFPTLCAEAARRGYDLTRAPVPVFPAAHYLMGGIATDVWGRTSLPGLYACGECACTGAHGANRLASNSLLEGLVFGRRIAHALASELVPPGPGAPLPVAPAAPPVRDEVRRLMWQQAGVVRHRAGLEAAQRRLQAIPLEAPPGREAWETANLVQVALLICRAALARQESRGSHYRSDFPPRSERSVLHVP